MKRKRLYLITSLAITLLLATIGYSRSKQEITPLLIGSPIPEVSVIDGNGNNINLAESLAGKPAIIIFYRGKWCPFCVEHLIEVAAIESELRELGYQIIAISPDSPARVKALTEESDAHYSIYSDSSLAAADAFGITWDVPEKSLKNMNKNYGHDLEKYSGGLNKSKLPVPAVFITTSQSKIGFQYVNPGRARDRIPGKLLLIAAETTLDFGKDHE